MPNCPHCHGIYFGNPDACPDCNYNFKLGRVVSQEELRRRREEDQRNREANIKANEERREKEVQMLMKMEREKKDVIMKNPRYEYKTEFLRDSYGGMLNKESLDGTLAAYAGDGWRLHSVFVNEAGKNSSSTTIGGMTTGTNATMDVTILIFERCIKPADY